MLNAENIKDAEQRRLAWRCRRGMLELDIVLQRFIAQHFNHLTLIELQAFDEMLELPDNDFWGLVSNEFIAHKNVARQSIIEKLHAL
jgi:antitoxin CptB